MFRRRNAVTPQPIEASATPRTTARTAVRLPSVHTINLGLTALASVGPRRFRPHAQAVLALVAAAQAVVVLFREKA